MVLREVRVPRGKGKGDTVHVHPRADCVTHRRVGSPAFYFTAKRYRCTAAYSDEYRMLRVPDRDGGLTLTLPRAIRRR